MGHRREIVLSWTGTFLIKLLFIHAWVSCNSEAATLVCWVSHSTQCDICTNMYCSVRGCAAMSCNVVSASGGPAPTRSL